ncbi:MULTISPECIES: class I SAM-dependent methyltransferase [unclassified Crossiella]|uniref:class I SAM-dependent methyltransferase n=1 Tax=unclassified Crossiella TaxID=2620835 RepID=UPI001FFECEA5|nr:MULTISPECIES: class I SAM-dependent methyltransferase [unclassified Crossiella]MCK2241491.1 class I SAM-dependent methyltransferase [Crossiella sp. S99.2]MCK2255637.1 class I SAM-dependent methyltransferase [Crossiella sp. S99.1]
MSTAQERWARQLADWAIPAHVLAGAAESPWVLPRQVFRRRAAAQLAAPTGATLDRARVELDESGSLLDIGAGAGASSLPLLAAGLVTEFTAVDADADLLAACVEGAEALGVPTRGLRGRWPDLATRAGVADVVVCGNVVYNVPDLAPFVAALTAAARRSVVLETAARHPLIDLNPLWQHFHGITRPEGPTVDDLIAALGELGVHPHLTRWRRPPEPEHRDFAELVETTRRRLCLPPESAAEVDRVLREHGHNPELPPDLGSSGRELATLTWPGRAD